MNSQAVIEKAFETAMDSWPSETRQAVEDTITQLDRGQLRVCEKKGETWVTHEWIKKAILLFFRLQKMELIETPPLSFRR